MLNAVANMSLSMPAAPTRGDAAIDLDLATAPVFLPALVTLCAACPALALRFPAERQRAGPHHHRQQRHVPLVPPLRHGLRAGVRAEAAMAVNQFFPAYLCADMIVGGLYCRAQIGFLAGWVVYIRSQRIAAHIFCLYAVIELPSQLPTFFLGAFPPPHLPLQHTLRPHLLTTRILFHIVLLFS
ncbi:hypothetical protein B0H19DRAFT_78135 [Mycena capillaripes]|nr:hypothetical protein B0H19DRAFT_78135 [Mycena capillaripes]